MKNPSGAELLPLDCDRSIWEQFYLPAPLIVVGSLEKEGINLAPKHMATPLGWDNYFGFVCTPAHRTYQNIAREQSFTVTFPRASEVVMVALSAMARCGDGPEKPILDQLVTFSAPETGAPFLDGGFLYLECELDKIIDGWGRNSLIAGKVIAAYIDVEARRDNDRDPGEQIAATGMPVFLYPDRWSTIESNLGFPFPSEFSK